MHEMLMHTRLHRIQINWATLLVALGLGLLLAQRAALSRALSLNWASVAVVNSVSAPSDQAQLNDELRRAAMAELTAIPPYNWSPIYLRYLTIHGQARQAADFLKSQPALLNFMRQEEFARFDSTALRAELWLDDARSAVARAQWPEAVAEYRQAFFVRSKPVDDTLLREYTSALANDYASRRSSNSARLIAAIFFWKLGDLARAEALLPKSAPAFPNQFDSLASAYHDLITADLLASQGKLLESKTLLRQMNQTHVNLYLQAQLRLLRGGETDATALVQNWRPSLSLQAHVSGMGTLRGVEWLDPLLIGSGGSPTALLFWSDANVQMLRDTLQGIWYCQAQQCVQEVTTQNLVPDPGFEWITGTSTTYEDSARYGPTVGFWTQDIYPQPKEAWRYAVEQRAELRTVVSCLDNSVFPQHSGLSGITTRIRSVTPGALYLQAGWVRTDGHSRNALLGRMWLHQRGQKTWSYLVAGPHAEQWTQHAEVVSAPPGAGAVLILAQNYDSPGIVCFDDLVLLRLSK